MQLSESDVLISKVVLHQGLGLDHPHPSGIFARGAEKDAAVAQLVEHVIRNDGVGGSSPFSGTILLKEPEYPSSPDRVAAQAACAVPNGLQAPARDDRLGGSA